MSSRTKLAALRILALREEFSDKELRNALPLARELQVVLASRGKKNTIPVQSTRERASVLSRSESRVVTELRKPDPPLYSILSKIDQSIRLGIILPQMADIRRVGCSFDKDFLGGKARKDAIPRLMETLAKLSVPELEQAYQAWKQQAPGDRLPDTGYDELAEFLVKGTSSPVPTD